jgi:hypothetical protein
MRRDVLEGCSARPIRRIYRRKHASIEASERIRALAARKFGDADGEELLEALCDATLRRPTFITQMGVDPMQALMFGAFREGHGRRHLPVARLDRRGAKRAAATARGSHQCLETEAHQAQACPA